MRFAHRLAAAMSIVALAAPAAAHAQSAGDNQYTDPFGSNQSGSSSSSSGSSGAAGSSAPQLAAGVPTGPGSEALATSQATHAGQLPNTGSAAGLIALAGAGLLMCGTGLRLRLRAPLA
ncbi:MAG TPA: LPXTG cell wall anchor domain-containing protein [Solirubrobacteraceae bacterium]